MKWMSREIMMILAMGLLAFLLLEQQYSPFLGKAGLTAFFSTLIYFRIREKVPQILAQTVIWAGLIIISLADLLF